MKKKLYAIKVSDRTCNIPGMDTGIYGRGDYSWITEHLNGGNGNYDLTEAEAIEAKADYERAIQDRNLEWASAEIDSVEIDTDNMETL